MEHLRVVERVGRTRRQWTVEQKVGIVEECLEGSVSATGRRHGVVDSVLYKWRRAYQEGRLVAKTKPPSAFTEAVIVSDGAKASPAPAFGGMASSSPERLGATMEVIALTGRRVVVGPDVDGAALARVLAVLEGA